MRIGIAGTGSIGRRHLANLEKLCPGIKIVVLRNGITSDTYIESIDADKVTSLKIAEDEKLDAIIIANQSAKHANLIIEGLKAGLHMYIEKPVVTDREQMNQVNVQLARSGINFYTQVGCNLRFLPSLIKLKELSENGCIGKVMRASFDAGQWLPDWRPGTDHRKSYSAKPEMGGGVLLDLIHEIDMARWILGDLTAEACNVIQAPCLEIQTEAAATALLKSHDGCLVQIGIDYIARRPIRRYQLIGEKGTLIWDLRRKTLVLETKHEVKVIMSGSKSFDIQETYLLAMTNFLEGIQGNTMQTQTLQDGLNSAKIVLDLKDKI
ncbi:possible oxidoreductase, GFO/Idh/MocA family protein [Synechococcus sp. BL107]|uniref:Gfo/Idh/MocA family protein n=1 Tax=Synechococcus sp. BL107 TaxID=313625 RepID=UPI0000E53A01|nr:Gfo/Idh/MocA family oxidoreductase [Synechococcus sp. BL107]EAU71037.1 possible oxidoreductase, GFO/Idh/MocA family protein [Synechococcus sp. BL107]